MDVPHNKTMYNRRNMDVIRNNNNTNGRTQQYFYVVDVLDTYNPVGYDMMPFKDHALTFQAPAHRAAGYLFSRGYDISSEEGLFEDNGAKFVSEVFDTTDGSNSTEDDVPDRLSVLLPIRHPYARLYPQARFRQLKVQRYIVPKQSRGGKSRRSRRSNRVGKRRSVSRRH